MAAMAQNGLSSNSDAWFTLRICSNVSSRNLVDPNICCYLLQTDLSDAFPFCAAVISVSHLGELYLGCFYICIPFFFLLFRKENSRYDISEYLNTGPVVLVKIMWIVLFWVQHINSQIICQKILSLIFFPLCFFILCVHLCFGISFKNLVLFRINFHFSSSFVYPCFGKVNLFFVLVCTPLCFAKSVFFFFHLVCTVSPLCFPKSIFLFLLVCTVYTSMFS